LITRKIFREQQRSSSLCCLLHYRVTLSVVGQIPSSAPYSRTPSAHVPASKWQTKFRTHTWQWAKLRIYLCIGLKLYIFG
jgi:hypothetical protein